MASETDNPYTDASGRCLFEAVLDAYDRWLAGIPHVRLASNDTVRAVHQQQLAREVWPVVEPLCIRLEASGKGELASRIERAYRDAEDYARILDDYCQSDRFDYYLWTYGDPACDELVTVDGELEELLAEAEAIGECDLSEDLHWTASQRQWAAAVGDQAKQTEIAKYGHAPTEDYAERTEMRAWACFWLAVQLQRRGADHIHAGQELDGYLSSHMVVCEAKDLIVHEALGRAYGMHIHRLPVLESEEVSRNLGNLVAVVNETKTVLAHRPPAAVKPPAVAEPAEEDGSPFYKPHYFERFHIGDELLRRNATDSPQYVPGKVRRRDQQTVAGKRAVYWYSEPDARRRWPDRFVGNPKSLPRS